MQALFSLAGGCWPSNQLKFYTKGFHSKWHRSWSRPALSENTLQSKIDNSFLGKAEFELCENPKASRFARAWALSDSSNASEGGDTIMRSQGQRKDTNGGEGNAEVFFRESGFKKK